MASAKFLEEALSTDVDESAVSALVGSLENQLVTSAPVASHPSGNTIVLNQNHVNSAISNGGTVPSQKHGAIANGDTLSGALTAGTDIKHLVNNVIAGGIISGSAAQLAAGALHNSNTNYTNLTSTDAANKANEAVNIVYSQGNPTMTSTGGTILSNRVTFPTQNVPNGTIGLNTQQQQQQHQTVLQTTATNIQNIQQNMQPKQQTLVIKTSAAPGSQPGLMTLPMNVTSSVPQVNNVGNPTAHNPNILSNLQVVNVRPGINTQQKGQPARVVLSAPQLVGARQGTPQLTLQSLQGLQPGQQGHLLLKTENGQYQLLRVGPAPAQGGLTNAQPGAGQQVTFRMQTVPTSQTQTTVSNQVGAVHQVTAAPPTVVTTTPIARPANDNTKEKCRKFLANLLELSSREPKTVERNVRSLIQDLIDMRVEPEDFCDRLERLLNASPQPCLIGFLKKSLPLLRHSLATKELTIEGIRPPPTNVVFSIASATPTIQTQIRPGLATSQVRLVQQQQQQQQQQQHQLQQQQGTPGTIVRPGLIQQRMPLRGAAIQQTRLLTAIRQQHPNQPVIVSSSQPPALHPVVYPNNQIRPAVNMIRQPMQVRPMQPGQQRPQIIRTTNQPIQVTKNLITNIKMPGAKPIVPSNIKQIAALAAAATKDREKKTFSSAYTGDDDINDVAAMGGVNLAEETQRILGSTEFVGTQIRSCKEEFFLSMGALQHRIRQAMSKHGLDEPSNEVAAVISHAAQERVKNIVEKLAIITEHRLEMVKSDPRYEVTSDVKGQLKFLEELDRAERKRHEEMEREMLLRAAKSRSKTEDPEQAKLKAKAKEMQRVEMEELRQREANATALQAIGPRKKPRLEGDTSAGSSQSNSSGANSGVRGQLPLKQRMKKVTLRDVQFLFESEKDLCRSTLLYKSYLK